MLEWLEAQGFEQPAEITIDGKVGYATRYYRRPQQTFQADWKILALLNSWPQIRRGVSFCL